MSTSKTFLTPRKPRIAGERDPLLKKKIPFYFLSDQNAGSHQRLGRIKNYTIGPDQKGDFQTIDLVNSKNRSYIKKGYQRTKLLLIYVVLILVSISTAIIAACLDLVVEWLTSLKQGICFKAPHLTREICCTGFSPLVACDNFYEWNQIISVLFPFVHPSFRVVIDFLIFLTLSVIFSTVAAHLVKAFAPYASGSGIPEVKTVLSGVVMKGALSAWTLVIKIVGLGLSVASSLNVGKEGPFVHLSSCLANVIARSFSWLANDQVLINEIIACACAAGVAVAFGAPIGGIIFAFEEASSYFSNKVLWRSFFCATLAALVLRAINPFFNGRLVIFEVTRATQWYSFEAVAFAIVGVFGGIIGTLFVRLNVEWTKLRLRSTLIKANPVTEVAIVTIITVCASYFVPFLRVTNNELLTGLFQKCDISHTSVTVSLQRIHDLVCHPPSPQFLYSYLGYAIISKFFLSVITFGLRLPAGLFIPSMTIGALLGQACASILVGLYDAHPQAFIFRQCHASSACVEPSTYAIIGAASVLGGVTQVSVSLAVIIFELTGGLHQLIPVMLGILFAKLSSSMMRAKSIYDCHINIKRYPFMSQEYFESGLTARAIMQTNVMTIPTHGFSIQDLEHLIDETDFYAFPVVEDLENNLLVGNIVRPEIEAAIKNARDARGAHSDTKVTFTTKSRALSSNGNSVHIDGYSQRNQVPPTLFNVTSPLGKDSSENSVDFSYYLDLFVPTVTLETPLTMIHELFSGMGIRSCMVTTCGKLEGIVSKKDLIGYMDQLEDMPSRYFL